MKKKIILIICTFLFITNVKALTFNVDITNIEDEGNNGTIGSIEKIDLENKELDVLFQDIGDEVSFSITVSNSGDRAGTLRNITFESGNDKIEYTTNLPENGLAINGNDTNKVIVTAKVKEGAVNGKTSSEVKIKYTYDEGSCPDGEMLSSDESMCLCPEGTERNEKGVCVSPPEDKKIECKDNEIYNETKKICEKKVVPVPSNPKTLDNIILITLLFIVSGLGIYAVMYKKLKTDKKKITVGVITGVITLGAAFSVLVSVFGLDNLLSAIVNPITKSKELVVTVNEEIDLIETWDGTCNITNPTKDNIFEGGTGTKNDPYQIKTANQLACFAETVNNGESYEGKYIKQIRNIKLNDHLNEKVSTKDLSNANIWIPIGDREYEYSAWFSGTYNGDNHMISGLYIDVNDQSYDYRHTSGLFGSVFNATIQNITLTDVYIFATNIKRHEYMNIASCVAYSNGSLVLKNIKTYGEIVDITNRIDLHLSGVISDIDDSNENIIILENIENNINITSNNGDPAGIISHLESYVDTGDYTVIMKNITNKGNIIGHEIDGIAGTIYGSKVYLENIVNIGNLNIIDSIYRGNASGLFFNLSNATLKDSHNEGIISSPKIADNMAGLIAHGEYITIFNSYNSGNISIDGITLEGIQNEELNDFHSGGSCAGLVSSCSNCSVSNSYNSGNILSASWTAGGLIAEGISTNISNSYNLGNVYGGNVIGGLIGSSEGTVIDNSFNKGNIVEWMPNTDTYSGIKLGGLTGIAFNADPTLISNSYNEGDISILAPVAYQASTIAGLGDIDIDGSITNSYNRGNLYSKYSKVKMCGISCGSGYISNVYNSGNITFDNYERNEIIPNYSGTTLYCGIGFSAMKNTYNLGNIDVNDDYGAAGIGGYTRYDDIDNYNGNINTGNITFYFNTILTSKRDIIMYGIRNDSETKKGNYGHLSIVDNTIEKTVSNPVLGHNIVIVEQNEENESETPPTILSIINCDNAFEIKEGENLPTLKVFNQ